MMMMMMMMMMNSHVRNLVYASLFFIIVKFVTKRPDALRCELV